LLIAEDSVPPIPPSTDAPVRTPSAVVSSLSKKDFKQMILDLQKDRLQSFSNFQNLQYAKQRYGEIKPKSEFTRQKPGPIYNQITKGYYLPQSSAKSLRQKQGSEIQLGVFNNT
jgi:hypothetical protein